jgi:hypothetical protein
MARSAVLVGRTTSDVLYNVISIAIMAVTGLLVGWRIRGSALEAVAGFLLLLLFAYAFSWVMAWVGLLVPSPEVGAESSGAVGEPESSSAVGLDAPEPRLDPPLGGRERAMLVGEGPARGGHDHTREPAEHRTSRR